MKHANVALFVPNVGCPHRCSFCDQRSISGETRLPGAEDVVRAAETARRSLKEKSRFAEIAFFGGSFTAMNRGYMCSLLEAAAPYVQKGLFAGIRISTRPDAADEETLKLLRRYGVTAIELGAQSMDDEVLRKNGRGHTAKDVETASARIRADGFSLGLQMMTGLYGDDEKGAERTARALAALHPDTVRIYPAIVMEGTELAERYRRGEYRPMALSRAVDLCCTLLGFFQEKGIRVIRLGLHSTPELERGRLAGPWHPAFRELCESRMMLRNITAYLEREKVPQGDLLIRVSPSCVSRATGQKRCNLSALLSLGYRAEITADDTVAPFSFAVTKSEGR